MLKRPIKYTNFNDEEVTGVFYFNLSKSELIELEMSYSGAGLQATMQRIIDTRDSEELIKEFQKIILMAYGVKSDDGESFQKSDEIREKFKQTAAYQALFMELATDENAASTFIIGIMPKDMRGEASKLAAPLTYNPDIGGPIPTPPLSGPILGPPHS